MEEGEILEIKINLGGYEPCIKKVNVYERLKIKAKLNKKPIAESSVSNVKVNVGIGSKTDEPDESDGMFLMKDAE